MIACCPTDFGLDSLPPFSGDLEPWVRSAAHGTRSLDLIVPGIVSASQMPQIEDALSAIPGVISARVNLGGRRVDVTWRDTDFEPQRIIGELSRLGFAARPFDSVKSGASAEIEEGRGLLRAVAVAGFATANIMLLSVSVWSGADPATRELFHWISAAIALPTVVYAGRPFFRSAARALAIGQVNMDVPISLAVCLAAAMSLFETIHRGEVAYFDAAVMLLFFLLTGRYFDHLMRARARSTVSQLMSLASAEATLVDECGLTRRIAASEIKPGMRLSVAAGERFASDGQVEAGASEIDNSLVTGESIPESVRVGSCVLAGSLNLTGPLVVSVTSAGEDTFLASIVRLMSAAEQSRSAFIRLADRLARFYSPAVHIIAGLTLLAWLINTGGNWHDSLMAAMAVLIITCPCALGLAVPAVHVIANGVLFRHGTMIKDGAALERLASVDTVVFDKTGTLTRARPRLVLSSCISDHAFSIAAGLAAASRHPLSRAVLQAAQERRISPAPIENPTEHPGCGMSGFVNGREVRLGSRAWCGLSSESPCSGPELALRVPEMAPMFFEFEDELRPDAARTVKLLKESGIDVEILSGDQPRAVERVARLLGITSWMASTTPKSKLDYLEKLKAQGRKVLMVGDGLNDAPALAAGHASMAPASATDVGKTAADTVFFGERLTPIHTAILVARRVDRLTRQNFVLAAGYNLLALPVAILGLASPLIAAVAMSTSSLIVIANSLRLDFAYRPAKVGSLPMRTNRVVAEEGIAA